MTSAPLFLSAGALAAIHRGHPWVYRDQVRRGLQGIVAGSEVTVAGPDGEPCARGIADPDSPIAVRIWTADPRERIVGRLLADRLGHAVELRARLSGPDTTALRWVHGEGDRAPGVVVDRYGHVAVLRLDGAGIAAHRDAIADALLYLGRDRGVRSIALRSTARGGKDAKLAPLRGDAPPDVIAVEEHGMPFLVQRGNRFRVGGLSKGRRVLNLFSYAGGFSLAAALGGATQVTSVDVAASAHATAQASFRHAGVSLDAHRFVTADVFQFLERARARKERWDLVVSDPPNMAPSEAARGKALAAYRKLHASCASVTSPEGLLLACSCSSHVSLDDFLGTLGDDVLARGDLRVLEISGAGSDHPVLPAFPEGRYLKACLLG